MENKVLDLEEFFIGKYILLYKSILEHKIFFSPFGNEATL